VIDAVSKGEADIGFVAYAPSRTGTVAFSQTYMLVRQSFLVPENSPIRSVADIDQPGRRIAGGKGDSITLFLARTLKHAKLIETDNSPADTKQKFANGEIDAFGANRQRLTDMAAEMPMMSAQDFSRRQSSAAIFLASRSRPQATATARLSDVRALLIASEAKQSRGHNTWLWIASLRSQ
jgi:ABC-type amino acid transport substrate-binding protein